MNTREWIERHLDSTPGKRSGGYLRRLLKAAPWIVVITFVVYLAESHGMLGGFNAAELDTFLGVHGRVTSNNVAIVEIGEKDYAESFKSGTPLCIDRLLQLVANVRSYGPAAIGVDLDTSGPVDPSDSHEQCDPDEPSPLAGLTESRSNPVIWAEVPKDVDKEIHLTQVLSERPKPPDKQSSEPKGKGRKREKENAEAAPETPQLPASGLTDLLSPTRKHLESRDFVGIPRFPLDSDGAVRRYESRFEVHGNLESGDPNDTSKSSLPSLARALVEASNLCSNPTGEDNSGAQLKCPIAPESKDPVYFNFYGEHYRFPVMDAGQFENSYDQLKQKNPEEADNRKGLLQNRIVLIGGTYAAARDKYFTPLGEMPGVELNALAVQSDLSGGGIREAQKVATFVSNIIFGILVVLVFYLWPSRPGGALSVALLGFSFVAVFLSAELFGTTAYFLNFMPMIIGITLQQSIELAGQAGGLQRELEKTRLEAQGLAGENKRLSDQLKLANLLWESRERDRENQEAKPILRSKARSVGAG